MKRVWRSRFSRCCSPPRRRPASRGQLQERRRAGFGPPRHAGGQGARSRPSIVIQEWWGLNDWVKDQARALAKEGYVALAVDLYRGKVATKQEDAHQLMMGTPPDRALRDLRAAFAYLQARPT